MGQQQSKGELLYQQVGYGNVEGIKSLAREGAGLEWMDMDGKTALIQASMNPQLFNVAKTLIDLGANVNAYRPGRNGGTPLHHAAKRGLDHVVKLLLSHGANALVMNDDCQTPLEVARAKGFSNVVRAIECHICLFAGWMREFYGPGFLEVLAPQLVSRKVWVVILPTGSRNAAKPFKLELAIYSSMQDAQPRAVLPLWRANLEEPKFHLPDPSVIIADSSIPRGRRGRRARRRSRIIRQIRIRLASAKEGDKEQLRWFCDACKGIPQAMHPPAFLRAQSPAVQATAPPYAEDLELAMAINASIQSGMAETSGLDAHSSNGAGASSSWSFPSNSDSYNAQGMAAVRPGKESSSDWALQQASPGGHAIQQNEIPITNIHSVQTVPQASGTTVTASAPHVDEIVEVGPIHYPAIDTSTVDVSPAPVETESTKTDGDKPDGSSSSCIICLDAPVEGACIPCGHMAGCMSCLNEIKGKKWGCPVCRAKIDQVVRLYAV